MFISLGTFGICTASNPSLSALSAAFENISLCTRGVLRSARVVISNRISRSAFPTGITALTGAITLHGVRVIALVIATLVATALIIAALVVARISAATRLGEFHP